MIRSTRTAALAAAAPSAGLVLALFLATAAAAPEAAPQSIPEPAASTAVPVGTGATPTADPTAAAADRGTRGSGPEGPESATPPLDSSPAPGTAESAQESADAARETAEPATEQPPAPSPSTPDAPRQQDTGGVDVGVAIDPPTDAGALAMTVASESTALTESGSTAAVRRFAGDLPRVTVRDTRTSAPVGPGWSVLGTATGLRGADGQPAIGVEHLGWSPRLLEGDDAVAGPVTPTVHDGGPAGSRVGLVEAPLLALADGAAARPGRWSADAELILRTPASVRSGEYVAVLTLSLFE